MEQTMEQFIRKWCIDSKIFTMYVPINSGDSMKYIYNVLNGNITREPDNITEMLYLGDYYAINGNDELMEKYHIMANDFGWLYGYQNLSHYYNIKKNPEKAAYFANKHKQMCS